MMSDDNNNVEDPRVRNVLNCAKRAGPLGVTTDDLSDALSLDPALVHNVLVAAPDAVELTPGLWIWREAQPSEKAKLKK